MDSKNLIKQYILTEIHKDRNKKDLEDTEPLIDGGIIDSLAIMKLLAFLEEKFHIQISGNELLLENFENLNAIAQLVERKRSSN
jgi:acyl carrier protein